MESVKVRPPEMMFTGTISMLYCSASSGGMQAVLSVTTATGRWGLEVGGWGVGIGGMIAGTMDRTARILTSTGFLAGLALLLANEFLLNPAYPVASLVFERS